MARNSFSRLLLKLISFTRFWISIGVRGTPLRSIGLIWTTMMSSVPVLPWNGNSDGLPM